MKTLRTLALVAAAGLLQACASAPTGPEELAYTGLVDSSGDLLPVTTVFVTDRQGATTGRYVFVEPDNTAVSGTLGPCRPSGAAALVCEWRDTYGRGHLLVQFSADGRSFNGRWGIDGPVIPDTPDALRWTGAR